MIDYAAKAEERRKAREMVEVYGRQVYFPLADLHPVIGIQWDTRDPDNLAMLEGVRAIPGRYLTPKAWLVPINIEAAEFLDFWEFPVKGKLRKLLSACKKAPLSERYQVTLGPEGLALVREKEYRQEQVPLSPALLDFAKHWGLSVDPEVEEAIARLSAEAQAAQRWAENLNQASRAKDPSELPPAILDKFKEMYP